MIAYASQVLAARALIALTLASCGGKHAPSGGDGKLQNAFPDGPPLATPGEHMSYQLALRGIQLAEFDLAIGDVTDLDGAKVVPVTMHAQSTGIARLVAKVDDRFTTWLDIATGRPRRFECEEFAVHGKPDIEHVLVDLVHRAGETMPVTVWVNAGSPRQETQAVTAREIWDLASFLVVLRAWEGATGSRVATEVFRSRHLWKLDIRIAERGVRPTALGDLPALRFDAHATKVDRQGRPTAAAQRKFMLWVSDDNDRVPLAIVADTDFGKLELSIVDYQPGTGRRLRP